MVQASWGGARFELPSRGSPALAVESWVTEEAARAMVGLAGKDLGVLTEAARSWSFVPVSLGIKTWGQEQILNYEAHTYHQPSDELRPEWNFDGMVEDAQFGFLVVLEIANADHAPSWVAGDEFEPKGAAVPAKTHGD